MFIKYQVNFLIEKRKDKKTRLLIVKDVPISCEVSFKSKYFRYYIGYRIDHDKWDVNSQKAKRNCFNKKGDSASDINRRIEKVRSTVNDIFDYYKGIDKTPTPSVVRDEIKDRLNENKSQQFGLFEKYEVYTDEADVSERRRKQLKTTKKHFENFSKTISKRITFETVNSVLLKEFENYLRTDKIPKSKNTIHTNMKRLSTFFNYALKHNWTETTPFKDYEFPGELYGRAIFLLKEELKQLTDLNIDEKEYDLIRDLFVLQCHLGPRVGDYIKFTKENVIGNSIKYIPEKIRRREVKVVEVPLSTTAKKIIKKYNYPDGKLMPFIHPNEYNKKLKTLFRKAKLSRAVMKYNSLTDTEDVVELATEATTHMARKTFIGILHKTQKNEVIASMSGHIPNSKAFERYYDIDINDKKNALKQGGLE